MVHRRKTEIVQVNLRLREGLRQQLVKETEKSGRSFNAEVVHRIEQSFSQEVLTDAVLKKIEEGLDIFGRRTGLPSGGKGHLHVDKEDKK